MNLVRRDFTEGKVKQHVPATITYISTDLPTLPGEAGLRQVERGQSGRLSILNFSDPFSRVQKIYVLTWKENGSVHGNDTSASHRHKTSYVFCLLTKHSSLKSEITMPSKFIKKSRRSACHHFVPHLNIRKRQLSEGDSVRLERQLETEGIGGYKNISQCIYIRDLIFTAACQRFRQGTFDCAT